ncbi:MAG: hypothetical protein QMD05_01990, partial [Candidatus Brocadiaceae bacterium]|nr:hypothetical protein [Candidatus Brocadiaceae bacterium]
MKSALYRLLLITYCLLSTAIYAEGNPSALEKEIEAARNPMAWDLGPETVDISNYTPPIQEAYK